MPVDTLQPVHNAVIIIHDTVFTKGENAYDLVYKIDYMYQNAWTRLVTVGAIITAFATIAVPLYLSFLRKKQDKVDKDSDKVYFEQKSAEIKKVLEVEFEQKLSDTLSKYSVTVAEEMNSMKASNFFLLGDAKLEKRDYNFAFINFITAIRYSLAAKDLRNVKALLLCIKTECIPHLSATELRVTSMAYSLDIESFLKEIAAADTDNLLFEDINGLRQAIGARVQQEQQNEKPLTSKNSDGQG